jgi:excisionase family DNA binding protein
MPRKSLDPSDALTKTEAAVMAGVTVRTISRWVKHGHLTRYVGQVNRLKISKAELSRFLAGTRT